MANDTHVNGEMTVIGRGTTIRGEVDFDQGAKILGVFEGKIRSKGEVHIADSADCSAEIDASSITIDGKTNGNIIARSRCRLSSNAKLTGDITAKTLLVEEGATFVGHCRVGEGVVNAQPQPKAETTPQVDFKPPWKGSDGSAESSVKESLAEANRAAAANAGAA